jgi:hypothetical protein
MSASAMVGDALICFRVVMTDLLHGRGLSSQNVIYFWHAKYQHVKLMAFLAWLSMPCLDNLVAGIPNAISEPSSAVRATANVGCTFAGTRNTDIECAQAITVVMLARAVDE